MAEEFRPVAARLGFTSLADIAAARYPLRVSVRGSIDACTPIMVDVVLRADGFSLEHFCEALVSRRDGIVWDIGAPRQPPLPLPLERMVRDRRPPRSTCRCIHARPRSGAGTATSRKRSQIPRGGPPGDHPAGGSVG